MINKYRKKEKHETRTRSEETNTMQRNNAAAETTIQKKKRQRKNETKTGILRKRDREKSNTMISR